MPEHIVSRLDTLPSIYLVRTFEILAEYGINVLPHLNALEIPTSIINSGTEGIAHEKYYALISRILDQEEVPGLGLRIGQRFSFADYGVLGYVFISSPTLREAIQSMLRYQNIIGAAATFSEDLHIEGKNAYLELFSNQPNRDLLQFDVELSFSQWASPQLIVGVTGFEFKKMNVVYDECKNVSLYEEIFQCPVFFNQASNELYFTSKVLEEPLSHANAVTAELCEKQCKILLADLEDKGGIVEKVKRIIIRQPGKAPSPEAIAGELNVSYRTLRRRLHEAGTSVTNILRDVRMNLARQYLLETTLTTKKIAFLIGYVEVNNFYRAFKQYYGLTPQEFRKRSKNKVLISR